MRDELDRFVLGLCGVVVGCAAFQSSQFAATSANFSAAMVTYNLIRLGVQYFAFCVLLCALLLAFVAVFVERPNRAAARHMYFLSTLIVSLIVVAMNIGDIFRSWIEHTGDYPTMRNALAMFAVWAMYRGVMVYTDAPADSQKNRAGG